MMKKAASLLFLFLLLASLPVLAAEEEVLILEEEDVPISGEGLELGEDEMGITSVEEEPVFLNGENELSILEATDEKNSSTTFLLLIGGAAFILAVAWFGLRRRQAVTNK